MMYRTNAIEISSLVQAMETCEKNGNYEGFHRHRATIRELVRGTAPSGSGIDCGTKFIEAESRPDRLVFQADFHHMNDCGIYDGWTNHKIIVTPSLASGFNIRVTGRDRNQIKDYLAETYQYWLSEGDTQPVPSD